jgi:hypothetical protein
MGEFNQARPHQGKWRFGKTPMQTFLDALPLARKKSLQSLRPHNPTPHDLQPPAIAVRQIKQKLLQVMIDSAIVRAHQHAAGARRLKVVREDF